MQGRSEDQRDLLDVESVAGHLLPAGSVFAFLAEHRRRLFPDAMFEDLFPSGRGRPSVPPDVMASVIVLQTLARLVGPGRGGCGDVRSAVEGGVWDRDRCGRVPSVDVDVLAASAGRARIGRTGSSRWSGS